MEKIVESFELYGKQYRLETGELAKQASGAVLVTQGDTTCLVTAVVSKEQKDYDFFPLTVDFIEKMYSVGRIPGGYLKREARPSEKGTLTARMIDRPIRPGFADGFKQEVHVVATTLVCDGQNPPDCICVGGASAALLCGGAPFDGPAACVRIARNVETGEFIVNPTYEEQETSDVELTIAGTADYISMVEAKNGLSTWPTLPSKSASSPTSTRCPPPSRTPTSSLAWARSKSSRPPSRSASSPRTSASPGAPTLPPS